MKKIVYITGCLGFIGSYITRKCLENGWYVRGIDKCTYAANKKHLMYFSSFEDKFVFEQIDINDMTQLYDCDYVINCAAETHVDNSIMANDKFMYSNVNGVRHLLELIKLKSNYSIPTFLHFSTDEVYGDIKNGMHYETNVLKPSNPYSATKAAADMLILAWARTYGIPYIIVRPTNNYGIGQYVEKLIPKSCKLISLGRKIPLHENGSPIRTWLHVEDTANAVIHLIQQNIKNEIFNISGGFEQSNLDTVTKIIKSWDENYKIENFIDFTYSRKGQDVRYAIDDWKLKSIGFKTVKSQNFDEEIKKIVNYYKKSDFIW